MVEYGEEGDPEGHGGQAQHVPPPLLPLQLPVPPPQQHPEGGGIGGGEETKKQGDEEETLDQQLHHEPLPKTTLPTDLPDERDPKAVKDSFRQIGEWGWGWRLEASKQVYPYA